MPVDIKYIVETEKELNIGFPEKFREKMMLLNGGEVVTENDDWNLFPFFDKSDKKRISRTCDHIALETLNARKWAGFPENAVAIAANGCGDLLILKPSIHNTMILDETIFIWFHETGTIEALADPFDELEE
ncbi:SMI1/KNR4 family protein [Flavobacterium sp.]|uniref:SMI1/KNR4 family protein n=1 Tax=Flavobacterium sp. TaxID=239 RepID=UPI004034C25F